MAVEKALNLNILTVNSLYIKEVILFVEKPNSSLINSQTPEKHLSINCPSTHNAV